MTTLPPRLHCRRAATGTRRVRLAAVRALLPFFQLAAAACVFPPGTPPFFATPAESPGWPRRMRVVAEYSCLVLHLPRGTPRDVARRILTDHAEYGDWELARVRRSPDGSSNATLRRRIIRPVRTLR